MATTRTANPRGALLNQLVAVEAGLKPRTKQLIDGAYHALQRLAPMSGIARSYAPIADDGDQLPGESTLVQVRVEDILRDVRTAMTRLLDVTYSKDVANCQASADVMVDGRVLLAAVPVTTLLTLEKRLVEIRTIFTKIPVLDVAEKWEFDQAANAWATPVTKTTRAKKVPRNHVLAPATDKHAAQVTVYQEDVLVGYWSTIKYSGAMPATRRQQLIERAEDLLDAVRVAREAANQHPVEQREMGEALFGYLLD